MCIRDRTNEFFNEFITLTAIHEVGHSFGTVEEIDGVLPGFGNLITEFEAISGWTQNPPNQFDYVQSQDGEWWYHEDSEFAYDYGSTNPFEDWATIWEAKFDPALQNSVDQARLADKIAIFDALIEAFNSVA